MRIIAGEYGGRTLKGPAKDDLSIRPSSDRLRQAMFNILISAGVDFKGSCGLDLFAGTGALGFEAASRGAKSVLWLEDEAKAIALIKANLTALGLACDRHFQVHEQDVLRVLSRPDFTALAPDGPLSWIFLDPPYAFESTEEVMKALGRHAASSDFLKAGGVVVLEVSKRDSRDFAACSGSALEIFDRRIYGEAQLLFWKRVA